MTYELLVEPEVHAARRDLPGNVRQRLRHAIENLAVDARPPTSDERIVEDISLPVGVEIRRLRLSRWRVVYAVDDAEG